MPALPTCPNGMRGKRALTSLAEYRLRMQVEETGSVFLADGRLPNRTGSLACRNSIGLGRHRSLVAPRFLGLLDSAQNRRCQPICFVSATVSNNFSSLCYSCREYQAAITRFLTPHFVEQITSRMRSNCLRSTESSRK